MFIGDSWHQTREIGLLKYKKKSDIELSVDSSVVIYFLDIGKGNIGLEIIFGINHFFFARFHLFCHFRRFVMERPNLFIFRHQDVFDEIENKEQNRFREIPKNQIIPRPENNESHLRIFIF